LAMTFLQPFARAGLDNVVPSQSVERRAVRRFTGLDLIRGCAALVVLVYHVDFMFGLRTSLLSGGYLAVDVFFVLSGFVLSLNYGDSVAKGGLSGRSFAVARLARLYPLFLATTLAGCVVMTARYRANFGHIELTPLVESAAANILLAPSFFEPYGLDYLFPFNPASWSIFFELVASLAFFLVLARVENRGLIAAIIGSGIALTLTIWHVGTIDQGYSTTTFLPGFPRVLFSFAVGIAIERAYSRRPWRVPTAFMLWLLLVALAFVQARVYLQDARLYDLIGVYLLAPAIVAAGAGAALEGGRRRVAVFLGDISYSVYLTQDALIIAAAGLTQLLFGMKIYDLGAWVGFVFVPLVMGVSYLSFLMFERPARNLIRRYAGHGHEVTGPGVQPDAREVKTVAL
jgi:peptidoglycan/LPS O-acetylase OafA/YrhL